MDFNLAQAFLALWQERSVSRAAARLSLTQPALSAALRRLRALTGDQLFVRSRNGMQPTTRAIAMAPVVEECLLILRNTLGQMTPFDPAQSRRHFVVGCDSGLDYMLGPALMSRLRYEAPGVSLAFRSFIPAGLDEALQRREVDLGVTAQPGAHSDCVSRPVGRLTMECIGSAQMLPSRLDLQALCASDHILIESARQHSRFDHALRSLGYRRTIRMVVPSFGHLPVFLHCSGAVAVVPHYIARAFSGVAGLGVASIPQIMEYTALRLLIPMTGAGDPGTEWLLRVIQDEMDTWQDDLRESGTEVALRVVT